MSRADVEAFNRWMVEVRDPADVAAMEPVMFRAAGARAEYRVAPIPAGWSYRHAIRYADGTGGGTPWQTPAPTKADAIDAAMRSLLAWLNRDVQGEQPGAAELHALINPDQMELF